MDDKKLLNFIKTTSNLPLIKIDRDKYLAKEFAVEYPKLLPLILDKGAYDAGVPDNYIEKVSKNAIKYEVGKSTTMSFLSGLPGGLVGVGAIPADVAQFLGHAIRIAQKLCYIAGMPSFSFGDEMTDEEAYLVAVYLGVMFEDKEAILALNTIGKVLGTAAAKVNFAVTSIIGYSVIASLLPKLATKLGSGVFAKTFVKAVPIIGGAVSGSITYVNLNSMSYKLYKKLKESRASIGQQ